MITIRRAAERGLTDIGWLHSRHTFSFGQYFDRRHMGFRSLRVINDDHVAPGAGFGTHPHRDMEIITLVLDGALAHRDSLGHESQLGVEEVQVMSAGSGIAHSEFNSSKHDPVHFLQVWIEPDVAGAEPRYEQRRYAVNGPDGGAALRRIAGPANGDDALPIHQDAHVYVARLHAGQTLTRAIEPGRAAWVHVARGAARLNGQALAEGDGAAIEDESSLALVGVADDTRVLLFDLA